MSTGAPQAPAGSANPPALLTALQVGKLLVPPRGKRRVLQWAEEEVDPCPHTDEPHGTQMRRFFELGKVKEWAAAKGYLSECVVALQEAPSVSTVKALAPPVGPLAGADYNSIEKALNEQLMAVLDRKPSEVGGKVIIDPKSAVAIKNLLGEWRRLRDQRHEESLRDGKFIPRRRSEEMLLSLGEVLIAGLESLQLDSARAAADVATSPDLARGDRDAVERLMLAALAPPCDALRVRLVKHIEGRP